MKKEQFAEMVQQARKQMDRFVEAAAAFPRAMAARWASWITFDETLVELRDALAVWANKHGKALVDAHRLMGSKTVFSVNQGLDVLLDGLSAMDDAKKIIDEAMPTEEALPAFRIGDELRFKTFRAMAMRDIMVSSKGLQIALDSARKTVTKLLSLAESEAKGAELRKEMGAEDTESISMEDARTEVKAMYDNYTADLVAAYERGVQEGSLVTDENRAVRAEYGRAMWSGVQLFVGVKDNENEEVGLAEAVRLSEVGMLTLGTKDNPVFKDDGLYEQIASIHEETEERYPGMLERFQGVLKEQNLDAVALFNSLPYTLKV